MNLPHAHSYRIRLLAMVLVLNLFVGALAGWSISHSYLQIQRQAEVTSQNLAYALESNLVNLMERVDVSLLALRDHYEARRAAGTPDAGDLDRYIERVRSRLPEVDAIRITDQRGLLIYGSGVRAEARVDLSDRPHFIRLKEAPAAELVLSHPQVSRINGKWVIVLARHIHQTDGRFDGMIFAAVTLDFLNRLFGQLDLGPGGSISLLDLDSNLIVHQPPLPGPDMGIGRRHGPDEVARRLRDGEPNDTFVIDAGPASGRTISLRRLGDYPLAITVSLDRHDYLADWRTEAYKLGGLVSMFFLLTLYAAWVQYRGWRRQQRDHATILGQEALYHELVEDTPLLVVRYLPDTRISFANRAFADFFGTTAEQLRSRPLLELFDGTEDRAAALAHLSQLTPEHPVATGNLHRVPGPQQQPRWTQWTDRAFFDPQGRVRHYQSVGEDITERKRTRDIQAARLRLLEYAAEHTMKELLVATLDEAALLTESSIGFYHFVDTDQKTLALQAWSTGTRQEYHHTDGTGPHDDIGQAGVWVEAVRERKAVIRNDCASLAEKCGWPDGHAKILRAMVVPVFRKGLIVAILGVGNKATPYTDEDLQTVILLADLAWDLVEGKRLEAELVEMATTDALTGLENRRQFLTRLGEELERLRRFDIPRAALLMLDLDHFKTVNDRFGHSAGDAVLRHFATLVRDELRKIDTGGRLGGEEFGILLLGADLAAAENFAHRLRLKVATHPCRHEGRDITITVSIGISLLQEDDAGPEDALDRADRALYRAKEAGRNRIELTAD